MNNKKIYYSVLIVLLLIIVVSTTYAFFAPQAGGTTSTNATVTSNTTDLLTFSINKDISFTVNQANFEENGQNQSGDATATATLTPNNKTGAATMHYYLYLNLQSNPISYSSENLNGDPELMLQVFDGSNQLVTLSDLGSQVTVKGVTGYDITALEGPIVLLDNHAISASNNTATIENWRIVITLINLDVNQNDNTGKEVSATITIRQDAIIEYAYWNDNYGMTTYNSTQMPSGSGLSGTYPTREDLALAYSNFSNSPVYIKTTTQGSNILGHEICVWSNNAELCFEPNYWESNGSITLAKVQNDLETKLGFASTDYTCSGGSGSIQCTFDGFACDIKTTGTTECYKGNSCYVNGSGAAFCYTGHMD